LSAGLRLTYITQVATKTSSLLLEFLRSSPEQKNGKITTFQFTEICHLKQWSANTGLRPMPAREKFVTVQCKAKAKLLQNLQKFFDTLTVFISLWKMLQFTYG